nr:MAG TPA: hypothetical protein [Caudoviricetes sp.]
MNKYAVWWDIIYYGHFEAETEWEAKLKACDGDEEEAQEVEACLIEPD